jgi:hypothetical protein
LISEGLKDTTELKNNEVRGETGIRISAGNISYVVIFPLQRIYIVLKIKPKTL